MNDSEAITKAFWTTVERQALRRSLELLPDSATLSDRGKPLSTFSRGVAETILAAGLLAYADRLEGKARYQTVSAPTGSGKSSYAWALVAALIEAVPGTSAVFLCETIDQCEDTYRELLKIVPAKHLAVWTSAHDKATCAFAPANGQKVYMAKFYAKDLQRRRIAVATHATFRGKSRGHLAQTYVAPDGTVLQRTLVVVDERPREVSLFDVSHGDVIDARDEATQQFGNGSNAEAALNGLHPYLGAVWETERTTGTNFRALSEPPDLSWFFTEEANQAFDMKAEGAKLREVIGLARALSNGYAFMARDRGTTKGGRFVGYRMDLPILPGTVLLDATSDIDGVSQIAPWRSPVRSPSVTFTNLTVTHMALPADILRPGEKVTEIVKKMGRARPYVDWIKRTVIANTKPGEEVLVVVHKALIDSLELLPDSATLGSDAYLLEGRKVAFINWGLGIGLNRWKDASSVFLFGEFHVPKRATVGTALGLLDQPAVGSAQLQRMESPNSRDRVFHSLHEGHLLRWEKQLAMRGNARNLTDDGVCGKQKLFITSEFARFVKWRERLFPGATFIVDGSSSRRRHFQGRFAGRRRVPLDPQGRRGHRGGTRKRYRNPPRRPRSQPVQTHRHRSTSQGWMGLRPGRRQGQPEPSRAPTPSTRGVSPTSPPDHTHVPGRVLHGPPEGPLLAAMSRKTPTPTRRPLCPTS